MNLIYNSKNKWPQGKESYNFLTHITSKIGKLCVKYQSSQHTIHITLDDVAWILKTVNIASVASAQMIIELLSLIFSVLSFHFR